jgi:hypothetical protein
LITLGQILKHQKDPIFFRGANLRQREEEDKMKRPSDLEAKIFRTL